MTVRFHVAAELPAALVLVRPKDGGDVLVVVCGDLDRATVRNLARLLLRSDERAQLSRFLARQARK